MDLLSDTTHRRDDLGVVSGQGICVIAVKGDSLS